MKRKKLTPAQFNRAARCCPKMREHTTQAARAVLVDDQRPADVQKCTGLHRQAVSRAAHLIYAHHLRLSGYPSDWESTVIHYPSSMKDDVLELQQRADDVLFTEPA